VFIPHLQIDISISASYPAEAPQGLSRRKCPAQPVIEKMRPEMVIEIQNGILNSQSSGFFPNEPFEKKPVMFLVDSVLCSDDYFGSHLF